MFDNYEIKCSPYEHTRYHNDKETIAKVKCTDLSGLENLFHGITNAPVIRQYNGCYNIPVLVVDYHNSDIEETRWKSLLTDEIKTIDALFMQATDIQKNCILLGKYMALSSNKYSYKQKANALFALRRSFNILDASDYKALRTMKYMIEHPEIKKTKVTFCHGASEFWVALGYKKYILRPNNYCIAL